MKKYNLCLIFFLLLIYNCEKINNPVKIEIIGEEVKWIGMTYNDRHFYLWHIDNIEERVLSNNWSDKTQCVKIILYKTEGYFIYSTEIHPNYKKLRYMNVDYEWTWEEK